MNSMKNSFKSLRLKTTRRPSPGTSRRTQSDAASIYNKNYPGENEGSHNYYARGGDGGEGGGEGCGMRILTVLIMHAS